MFYLLPTTNSALTISYKTFNGKIIQDVEFFGGITINVAFISLVIKDEKTATLMFINDMVIKIPTSEDKILRKIEKLMTLVNIRD